MWFWITVAVSMAYNFQIGNNKIKLFTEYEFVTQKVLFGNAVLILQIIKLFELHFHVPSAVLFYYSWFENYRPRKPRQ
jgi:hypothetical protein